MQQLTKAVYAQDYYIELFVQALNKHEMGVAGIFENEYSDAKIIAHVNNFWLDLPDSPEVRTGPFWLLCEIAEHCFD